MKTKKALSYRDAGVDIEAADALVDQIKGLARGTRRAGVLAGIGGFGALFELGRYRSPVLVSGTDGVGTKLKLAIELKRHNTIGIDLVAMCVNDILTTGAEPLFFLDYYATGKLNAAQAKIIIAGISEGCCLAQTALIGGETAEMPGLYQKDDYDLAGFCVGVVEKNQIIDGSKVRPGDALIALASSGPHSNGYSLIRKILKRSRVSLNQRLGKYKLSDLLLMPTRIYVQPILKLLAKMKIHAMAHITGGGLLENIPRVLPPRTQAVLYQNSWKWPEIFHWIQSQGNVATTEMQRTFNLGVGMVLCVPKTQVKKTLDFLKKEGENAWLIGEIETSKLKEPRVVMR